MEQSPAVVERQWEEPQGADRAPKATERRKWLLSFALVAALVALALATATLLANLGVDKTSR